MRLSPLGVNAAYELVRERWGKVHPQLPRGVVHNRDSAAHHGEFSSFSIVFKHCPVEPSHIRLLFISNLQPSDP